MNIYRLQMYTMPDTVLDMGHVVASKTKLLPHEAYRLEEKSSKQMNKYKIEKNSDECSKEDGNLNR